MSNLAATPELPKLPPSVNQLWFVSAHAAAIFYLV